MPSKPATGSGDGREPFTPDGRARFSAHGSLVKSPPGGPVIDEGCLGCGLCRDRCPAGAIGIHHGKYQVGPACRGCLTCLEVCPAGAVSPG